MLRIHRIPYSTNVERVALAAAHKGLAVVWVDHDPADRSTIRAVSGQDLVPVAQLGGGEVVVDSMAILERLEALRPEPPLYPADPAARARLDIFVAWFDRVWKVAPNALEAGTGRAEQLASELTASRDVFEGLLADGPYLLGGSLTAADLCAFPFLKWGTLSEAPADAPRFEHILVARLAPLNAHPRLRTWIRCIDALPRA